MLNSSSFSCCCFKFSSSDRPFTIKIIRKLENLLIRLLRIEHTETESAVPTSKCYTSTRKAFSKMSKKGLKKEPTSFPEMMESKREWKMAIKWKSFIKEDRQRDSTLPRFSFSTDCSYSNERWTGESFQNNFELKSKLFSEIFSLKTVEKD